MLLEMERGADLFFSDGGAGGGARGGEKSSESFLACGGGGVHCFYGKNENILHSIMFISIAIMSITTV